MRKLNRSRNRGLLTPVHVCNVKDCRIILCVYVQFSRRKMHSSARKCLRALSANFASVAMGTRDVFPIPVRLSNVELMV
jgi:hypothetical protein